MRRQKTGFTMVELIVSIAIIGIISAIAAPSFMSFMDASRLSFSVQLVETTLGKGFSQSRAKPVVMMVRGWAGSRRMEFVTEGESGGDTECSLSNAGCQQLDWGVSFRDDFEIRFTPPYGDISSEGSETDIVLSGATENVTVRVHHVSGLVESLAPEKK